MNTLPEKIIYISMIVKMYEKLFDSHRGGSLSSIHKVVIFSQFDCC